jgi:hypothetical protein
MNEQQGKYSWANNKSSYIAAGIFVLVVIIVGVYVYNHQGGGTQNNTQPALSQNNNTSPATSTPTSTPASTATSGARLSYGAAIKAYPERFQFSNGCQGTPAIIAVRKGTPVMLDNRNATAYTFKADAQTFKIAGYGYVVFYPEVLENLVVTCNGKPSVTLNVEK